MCALPFSWHSCRSFTSLDAGHAPCCWGPLCLAVPTSAWVCSAPGPAPVLPAASVGCKQILRPQLCSAGVLLALPLEAGVMSGVEVSGWWQRLVLVPWVDHVWPRVLVLWRCLCGWLCLRHTVCSCCSCLACPLPSGPPALGFPLTLCHGQDVASLPASGGSCVACVARLLGCGRVGGLPHSVDSSAVSAFPDVN